jgi:5-formyltetrahydrofolate cyclo-ligase
MRNLRPKRGTFVAAYWPSGDQVDIRPLMATLHKRGCCVALPAAAHWGGDVLFRRWVPDCPLAAGPYGILQPGEAAPAVRPRLLGHALLMVPVLAFDRHRRVILEQAGYYGDIMTADPKPVAGFHRVGIAFASQEIDAVPQRDLDRPFDTIVTERRVVTRRVARRWLRLTSIWAGDRA